MDPELQKQLTTMLGKLIESAQDATNWTAEQLPSLIHEKLVFGRIWETGSLLIFIALIVILNHCAKYCWNHIDDDDGYTAGFVGSIVGIAFMIGCIIVQLYTVTQVWFTPRLYIVEWLIGMLHNK